MPPKKAGKGAKMVAEPSKEKKKKGAKSGKKRKESYAIYIYKVRPDASETNLTTTLYIIVMPKIHVLH